MASLKEILFIPEKRGLTDRSNRPPLRPDARIGQAAHQFN